MVDSKAAVRECVLGLKMFCHIKSACVLEEKENGSVALLTQ